METLLKQLAKAPVIPAARNLSSIEHAAQCESPIVFLLGCSILTLPKAVEILHKAEKRAFVHIDLAEGLGKDESGVEWCIRQVGADGIISTRPSLLKTASELGALTIQRLFLMDSASFEHGKKLLRATPPDMAEILPGIAPKAIRSLCETLDKPVIAGGLITDVHEIALALQAGACAVSVGEEKLWSVHL